MFGRSLQMQCASLIDYQDNCAMSSHLAQNGVIIIENHQCDLSLLLNFYEDWQQFFESDTKYNYQGDLSVPMGYVGKEVNAALQHENFYYFKDAIICPKYLRELSDYMFIQLREFAKTLLATLYIDLNPDKLLYIMRILYYPKSLLVNQVCNHEHTDKSILTLLPMATSQGLEVYQQSWTPIELTTTNLCLMTGDKIIEVQKQPHHVPLHRVTHSSQDARLALAFFMS